MSPLHKLRQPRLQAQDASKFVYCVAMGENGVIYHSKYFLNEENIRSLLIFHKIISIYSENSIIYSRLQINAFKSFLSKKMLIFTTLFGIRFGANLPSSSSQNVIGVLDYI